MILENQILVKVLIINTLDRMSKKINKWRKDFLIETFMLFLSIKGRINFLQLSRFGHSSEQRFRQQFEKPFDFLKFNVELVQGHGSGKFAIAFDPSYINKSGKKTPGLGMYWSGCAQKNKWGLEIGGLAAIDIENNTGFHLEAVQTPGSKGSKDSSTTLIDWYGQLIEHRVATLITLSKYFLADAYFSKKPFVDCIIQLGMHLISRLRDDADLLYLYKGGPTGKKGKPRKYAGKIKLDNIDKDYFEKIVINEETTIYSAVVYSKSLKRNIKLAYTQYISEKGKVSYKLYFSTDLEMEAPEILHYYHSRFQIEFLYRDSKQHTGLEHSQARSENKLHFHFNSSLTSINIAKVAHWLNIPKEERKSFSMSDIKTLYHNMLLLERFFKVFAVRPNLINNTQAIKELIYYGTIAA
jgi:hypothetical protein